MEEKKLFKSDTDKKLAGVCGGLAEYFDLDPVMVRVIWFVFTWFAGIGLIGYIALAIFLPHEFDVYPERRNNDNME